MSILCVILLAMAGLGEDEGTRAHKAAMKLLQEEGEGSSDVPEVAVPKLKMPKGLRLWQDEIPGGVSYDGKVVKWKGRGNVKLETDTGVVIKARRAKFQVDVESEGGGSKVFLHDRVQMRSDEGVEIYASEAQLDHARRKVEFRGDVSIYSGNTLTKAEGVVYDYEKEEMVSEDLQVSFDPFLVDSSQFRKEEENGRVVYVAEDAGVTTHDVESPSFWMRGGKVKVYPEEKVVFRDLKVEFGGRSYLWFPYYEHALDEDLGYRFYPGGRSNWGLFWRNRYGVLLGGGEGTFLGGDSRWLLSQWKLDYYSLRGVGLGLDLYDRRLKGNNNYGWLKLYHIYDQDPTEQRVDTSVSREGVDRSRYKVQLRHRLNMDFVPQAEGYLDSNLTFLSDRFYLEDFEPSIYAREPEPDNTIAVTQKWDYSELTAWSRLRLNDFYQIDQRLPEVAFEQVCRPILGGALLHEGAITAGIYEEELADFEKEDLREEFQNMSTSAARRSEIEEALEGKGYSRFHIWQEFSRMFTLDGKVNVTPRAGLGYTLYDGMRGPLDSEERGLFYAGVDASMKWSKVLPDIQSERWGLDGLLHVVQPYSSLSLLTADELDARFRPIEQLTATTRPRPLKPGRYPALDDFEDWSILRLGLKNKFLTRRDGGTHEWLLWDTYLDFFVDDGEFNRSVSNLYNEFTWRPLPWLFLSLDTQFPITNEDDGFMEIATSATWLPNEDLSISFSQRWLNGHPFLTDSNRIALETYYRVNEIFGLGMQHQWEWDTNTLEFQRYGLHWQASGWTLSLALFHRDNPSKDEYGVLMSFGLLNFPDFSIPVSIDGA